MAIALGIAGVRRSAAAALARDGELVAFCEQERLTRQKHVGLAAGSLPREAIDCVLDLGSARQEPFTYAVAEDRVNVPPAAPVIRFDHHLAHAVCAFASSPFDAATVLVCDRHRPREISVGHADAASGVRNAAVEWLGLPIARVYSDATEVFGLMPGAEEFRLEILAELGSREPDPSVLKIHDELAIRPYTELKAALHDLLEGGLASLTRRAAVAAAVQRLIAGELLNLVRQVRRAAPNANLCLAGGLFFNTFLTTTVARSGVFDRTFVPVNPGNAGVAAGAAVAAVNPDGASSAASSRMRPWSPFLGPGFTPDAIKATLDNCKLSYEFLRQDVVIDRTVDALKRGRLVGWFQGRMEWGARGLGNRSILASPFAPFTSENLNRFLKHRPSYRSYSVSIRAEDAAKHFDGPASSDFMEFEYTVRDPTLFRGLLPTLGAQCRVQTVPSAATPFRALLDAFGSACGVPALVNTSFNGFSEPIVCTPRDAVRVFYGTGLDVLVIGNFLLEK